MALSAGGAWSWQESRIKSMQLADEKALEAANERAQKATDDASYVAQSIAGNLTETITTQRADYERQLANSKRLLANVVDCNAIPGDALGLLESPGGKPASKDAAPAGSDNGSAEGTVDWRTVVLISEQNRISFAVVHDALDACVATYEAVRSKVNQAP